MKEQMRKYCWEDFIEDDSFFAAAKRNDQLYLNNVLLYLKDYPQQSKMAEEAFAFISALKIVKKNILVEDIDEEYGKFLRIIHQNKQKKNKLLHWIYGLVAVFVLGCVLIPFYNYVPEKDKDRIISYFDNMNIDSENVQMIVGSEKVIELKHDCAEIQLLEDGSVRMDSNVIVPLNTEETVDGIAHTDEGLHQLIVPKGKRSTLVFADGTKIWINSGTKILYPKVFSKEKREFYVDGEVFVEAAKEKERPLIVHTDRLDVKVLGTTFNVTAYQSEPIANVVLVDGKVEVCAETNNRILLSPNQLVEYNHSNMSVRTVDVYKYICWKDGLMQFTATPLSKIIPRISKYYDVNIIIDKEAFDIKCTGKIDLNNNITDVLKSIALTASVEVERIDEKTIKVHIAAN